MTSHMQKNYDDSSFSNIKTTITNAVNNFKVLNQGKTTLELKMQ